MYGPGSGHVVDLRDLSWLFREGPTKVYTMTQVRRTLYIFMFFHEYPPPFLWTRKEFQQNYNNFQNGNTTLLIKTKIDFISSSAKFSYSNVFRVVFGGTWWTPCCHAKSYRQLLGPPSCISSANIPTFQHDSRMSSIIRPGIIWIWRPNMFRNRMMATPPFRSRAQATDVWVSTLCVCSPRGLKFK